MTKTTSKSQYRVCYLFGSFEFWSRAAQALAPRVRYCFGFQVSRVGFKDFLFLEAELIITDLALRTRFSILE